MPLLTKITVLILVLLDLLLLHTHRLVVLGEVISELLVGRLLEDCLLPQVGGQVGISSLGEVTQGAGGATGRGVAVVNTSHLQQLLGHGGGDDAGSSGSGDEPHPDGAALAGDLAGHSVGATDLVSPEAPPNWDDGELGQDDGATDGSGHLLGALDTETNVAVVISNGDKSLESCPLTSPSLPC